jgi:heparan-sulfate lyase
MWESSMTAELNMNISFKEKVIQLLNLLNLESSDLEKVRAVTNLPESAAVELLSYYRSRTSVKHPVQRTKDEKPSPDKLSTATRQVADDALRNILATLSVYPRFDFGKEIDWFTNRAPNKDNEWLWQLHRHYSWDALAEAYRYTRNEEYARCYVRQLLDWIKKCPLQKNSPAWRTIEAGIRGYSWTGHFQSFLDSDAYTPEVLINHLLSFYQHAEYLTSRDMSRNNWGLMEAEGAAFIAMTFPEFKSASRWRRKAFNHLKLMIKTQVRPDGHQYEQCLNYHMGCILWFARTAEMAEANGLKEEFGSDYWKSLEMMCEIPMKLCAMDGAHPQFGDTSSQLNWRATLAKYARLFKREDMLYVATEGKEGKPPAETCFALPYSGFYSMRSGWDSKAIMLVLKCGPDGGWHCQPDNGTFEIFAGSRRLTPDSGTYIYHGDENALKWRKWFRQTRVHQTLTLDGVDTAYAPALLLWQTGKNTDVLVVENQSYKHLKHRRAVLFVEKRFFILVDDALGESTGTVMLHFQFPPVSHKLQPENLSAHTEFDTGANLLIKALPRPGLKLVPEEGWVSFKYGSREPRPAFRFEVEKQKQNLRFVTVLVPFEEIVPEVEIGVIRGELPEAKETEIEIRLKEEKFRASYKLP